MSGDPYISAASSLRSLAQILTVARALRFLPSRRVITERAEVRGTQDVSNPTLDVVLDAKRSALSDEVARAHHELLEIHRALVVTEARLRRAVALFDNDTPEGTDHV